MLLFIHWKKLTYEDQKCNFLFIVYVHEYENNYDHRYFAIFLNDNIIGYSIVE